MEIFRRFQYLSFILLIFFQNCSQTESSESAKENSEPKYYTVDDFKSVKKIDAHVHIRKDIDTVFIKQAEEDNFRLLKCRKMVPGNYKKKVIENARSMVGGTSVLKQNTGY